MEHLNIEIKAKCGDFSKIRKILKEKNVYFKGIDHQIDTYFKVKSGRLKLREGNIENYLIHYDREDKNGPKLSNVSLYKSEPKSAIKEVLIKALGILVVIDKQREIYFINNVKFHLDKVKNLGTFVEIEAIDDTGEKDKDKLLSQCQLYLELFKISEKDLISVSYSDLLIDKK